MLNNLSLAQEFAWSLATSLMACVTLFRSDTGYGAIPTAEFDGDPASVVHEYDPWER
jgi:hypothetical protein